MQTTKVTCDPNSPWAAKGNSRRTEWTAWVKPRLEAMQTVATVMGSIVADLGHPKLVVEALKLRQEAEDIGDMLRVSPESGSEGNTAYCNSALDRCCGGLIKRSISKFEECEGMADMSTMSRGVEAKVKTGRCPTRETKGTADMDDLWRTMINSAEIAADQGWPNPETVG